MKILFSSYHNPHFATITEYVENAIMGLGHELVAFDDRQHMVPGRIRQRVKWLQQWDIGHINRQFVRLALNRKPDVAIVAGGHRITEASIERLNRNGICTVLWTIDAPRDFGPIIRVARRYSYIFCQGTEAVELLEKAGIRGAEWLPAACDPELHGPAEVSGVEEGKDGHSYDVVFVGSYYPNRERLFENLADFDLRIWGPGWQRLDRESPLRDHVKAAHTPPSEWITIYGRSKIILASHYRASDANLPCYQASPRVFEALACRGFVAVDNQRDVFRMFSEGKHLVSFKNAEDLRDKVEYYLKHPDERKKIASAGHKEVLNKHTYRHRIETILSNIR